MNIYRFALMAALAFAQPANAAVLFTYSVSTGIGFDPAIPPSTLIAPRLDFWPGSNPIGDPGTWRLPPMGVSDVGRIWTASEETVGQYPLLEWDVITQHLLSDTSNFVAAIRYPIDGGFALIGSSIPSFGIQVAIDRIEFKLDALSFVKEPLGQVAQTSYQFAIFGSQVPEPQTILLAALAFFVIPWRKFGR